MDVYMTASLTHGNSDNVVNTVTITNGNFDDATITTQLGQMLASVNLTLTNKPWYVTSGHRYQVKVTVTVYNTSGKSIETTEEVSSIVKF